MGYRPDLDYEPFAGFILADRLACSILPVVTVRADRHVSIGTLTQGLLRRVK
jgi:hypothetical protein